jgi:translation initiation factor 3 subunit J
MDSSDDDDEDDATRRRRLRETEINSDLAHAEDLFGAVQVPNTRVVKQTVILTDSKDPMSTVDLATMPLFNPKTKEQFTKLRETLIPLIGANSKHAQYTLFMQEFTKQICKDLPSDQIKKIASGLTTLSNEKMKEEKAAEKGGKKKNTKAKTVLKADKSFTSSKTVDTMAYDDDGLDEYDYNSPTRSNKRLTSI